MTIEFTQPILKIKRTLKERWYVEYKLKDHLTDKWIQRKEYGNINRLKSKEERKVAGEQLRIKILNELESEKLIRISNKTGNSDLTISTAITNFLKPHLKSKQENEYKTGVKNVNSTYDTYKRYLNYFKEYCKTNGLINKPLKDFEQRNIKIELLEWISTNKNWKEQTKKNFISKVKLFFKHYYQKGILNNDITNFRLKFIIDTENNEPFTDIDLENIIPYMRNHDQYLLLYCQFIYYMFLRPLEVLKLRIEMIDFEKRELHLPSDIQKVKKKNILPIPPQLFGSLSSLALERYDSSVFIFSKKGYPSNQTVTRSCFYYRFEKILKKFNLWKQNKGLYSFKHTGVIHLWNHMGDSYSNRMNIIKCLCRHSSFSTTMEYLKRLRLTEDELRVERRTL